MTTDRGKDNEPSTYERIVLQRTGNRSSKGRINASSHAHPNVGIGKLKVSAVVSSDRVIENSEGTILWHVWNPDNSRTVAMVSSRPDPTSITIYSLSTETSENKVMQWKILYRLKGRHDRPVTHFDWSDTSATANRNLHEETPKTPATNGRIVSCGEDCRAFVWSYNRNLGQWTAGQQVMLQQQNICFTPICCQWDPTGERFAVAMGGVKKVASLEICRRNLDVENNRDQERQQQPQEKEREEEWTAYRIGRREIRSSLLCLDWHPCRQKELQIVACGGCDGFCRVYSVSDGELDSGEFCSNDYPIPFNQVMSFGKQYAEFTTDGGGWVEAVAWSPSGETLAYCSHNSRVSVVSFARRGFFVDGTDKSSPLTTVTVIQLEGYLPMCGMLFCHDDRIVTGGYDGKPVLISRRTEAKRDDGEMEDRCWCIENNSKWEFWNNSGSMTSAGNSDEAIRCVKWCPLRLGLGIGDTAVDQVPSVCASLSGADGSFQFFELRP